MGDGLKVAAAAAQRAAERRQGQVLVLARDPLVIAAADAAARRVHGTPARVLRSGSEALARLAASTGQHPMTHLFCDPAAAGSSWQPLLAALEAADSPMSLDLVSAHGIGLPTDLPARLLILPAHVGELAAALDRARDRTQGRPLVQPSGRTPEVTQGRVARSATGADSGRPEQAPDSSTVVALANIAGAEALRAGMSRGEIVLRYQPVVRLRDRKPVMVEALARWHRQPRVVGPDQFVPLAERAGLVRALSIIVASRAAAEMAPLCQNLDIGVSLNLPLGLLLQDDLTVWLARALGHTGMRPRHLAIELTETTPVEEFTRLRRALVRLRQAGYRVLLDDMAMDDGRERLLDLPFAACKLDRGLVSALPDSARARRTVQRLVRTAERNGQTVIAEGVADIRLWQAVRGLGVHNAQGFIVGRPLPPEAIRPWWSAWRSGRLS